MKYIKAYDTSVDAKCNTLHSPALIYIKDINSAQAAAAKKKDNPTYIDTKARLDIKGVILDASIDAEIGLWDHKNKKQ